jgi:thiamine-monophosphate kinase
MKLRDIGEDRLLGQVFSRLSLGKEVVNGLGDDCAVVETRDHRNLLVLKTDCVVAGMHFLPTANALHVGWKAMMRPLSDHRTRENEGRMGGAALSWTEPGREAI